MQICKLIQFLQTGANKFKCVSSTFLEGHFNWIPYIKFFFQGNDHYLSVIIVVIEGKYRNATHFFGLVKLGTDQSAQAQFNALKQRFVDDDVWTSIRKNLVALVM